MSMYRRTRRNLLCKRAAQTSSSNQIPYLIYRTGPVKSRQMAQTSQMCLGARLKKHRMDMARSNVHREHVCKV